jgi:hypothetical protein
MNIYHVNVYSLPVIVMLVVKLCFCNYSRNSGSCKSILLHVDVHFTVVALFCTYVSLYLRI